MVDALLATNTIPYYGVTQHDFLKQSDAVFSKELAIAKPAKYI